MDLLRFAETYADTQEAALALLNHGTLSFQVEGVASTCSAIVE